MHALHRILVYIPDVSMAECHTRLEKIQAIRAYAEDETESFTHTVFDWRETATAGGWSMDYGENVLLGSECPDKFEQELITVCDAQRSALDDAMNQLSTWKDGNIRQTANELWNLKAETASKNCPEYIAPYLFLEIAQLVYGKYIFDSYFYNTTNGNSRVTEQLINDIKAAPGDWALVLFDCHN